ncbi:MAG TPA: hypothetical protein VFO57_04860 [Burkholderiales bacterium]|nr:hypothetical protein [Burkholderiales bacterium]
MNSVTTLLLAGSLAASCWFTLAQAQDSPPPAVVTGSSSQVETRLVGSFSGFAGSDDNAQSLVTGLRQGSEITLTAAGTGGQAGETATFTPPTRPMGYGNVRISLALAQESLAQNGITQPTPEQLKAALAGGTIATGTGEAGATTQLPGILQMRADGMGWGQIANSMGVKLGHVISGRTGQPAPDAPSTAASTAAGAGAGVTTAGQGSTTGQTQGRGNSAAAHQSHRAGTGIVTAAGGSGAAIGAGARVNNAGGAGVVTGAGAAAGSRASAAGVAHGKGHAKP